MSSSPPPAPPPALPETAPELAEQEPLLGRSGANTQPPDVPLWHNLFSGTAPLAQVGALILVAAVWGAILGHPLILFSAHPMLNSAGVFLALQSALILQPTHTTDQKRRGAIAHSILIGVAIASLYSAFVVILVNKIRIHHGHFDSVHGILGLSTYIALFLQATLGVLQFYFPALVGGVDQGKALYKYHRIIGYAVVLLILATLVAATYTTYNVLVLHIRTWVVVVAGALVLAGTLPRVKLQKLGLKQDKRRASEAGTN